MRRASRRQETQRNRIVRQASALGDTDALLSQARRQAQSHRTSRYHAREPRRTRSRGRSPCAQGGFGGIVKLVVGLGNPGSQYAGTRHNVGWMVLDRLADRAGRSGRGRQRDASESVQVRYKGMDLTLAKPLTYMNDSGVAVRKLLARDRVPLVDLLVVTDDFSLPFGKLRFREGGTHGGHNGLRSVIDELGTEKIARLRVGIGEPGRGAIDHVLSTFAADEKTRLPILLDAAADAVETWAKEGTSKAANRFNSFELQAPAETDADGDGPKPGEVGGPADEQGIRRTKTGWRRILPGSDEDDGESKGSKGSKGR